MRKLKCTINTNNDTITLIGVKAAAVTVLWGSHFHCFLIISFNIRFLCVCGVFGFGFFVLFCFLVFFCFLGPHLWHMEVPAESELQLSAYTTATAAWAPRHTCDLYQQLTATLDP